MFARPFPRRFERIELDADHRNAKQSGVADRLRQIIAHPVGRWLDAKKAALAGRCRHRLYEIRPVGEIGADQRVGCLPVVTGDHDALRGNHEHGAGIGFAAQSFELAVEPVDQKATAARIVGSRQRRLHIGIERQHHRQVILPSDLGVDRVGDEL